MDIVRLHERALDETARLVGGVRPDQMDLPTPCSDWDVRTLIAHLVGGKANSDGLGSPSYSSMGDGHWKFIRNVTSRATDFRARI